MGALPVADEVAGVAEGISAKRETYHCQVHPDGVLEAVLVFEGFARGINGQERDQEGDSFQQEAEEGSDAFQALREPGYSLLVFDDLSRPEVRLPPLKPNRVLHFKYYFYDSVVMAVARAVASAQAGAVD